MRKASVLLLSMASLVACFVACSGVREGRTHLADGSYKLSCRKPLADCLMSLTDVCKAHGYDVVTGKQEIKRYGVEPVDSTVIDSEAIIRCRTASTLWGGAAASASAPATTTTVSRSTRCFPGTTQACLGPGACKGAQICDSGGIHFGPCDCGGASAPGLAEAGDAGPPPTWAVPPDGGAPP